uniref:Transcription initiation factor TFIID subunit 11 n=1 Tax=Lygus hesperus TaxID=30085 RepID=A0A0A9YQW7_LYGHE
MLKFLTHKLKNHSINEDSHTNKVEEQDHDSGTESDDEQGVSEEPEISMESEGGSVITTLSRSQSSLLTPASPYFLDSALPSDTDLDTAYDLHSSEEELEVINSSQPTRHTTGQEKRKWSQVTPDSVSRGTSELGTAAGCCAVHNHKGASCVVGRCRTSEAISCCSASSDDEVVGLVAAMAAPVQFRTSPPRGTHRPHLAATAPHEPSPRKRHRNAAPPRPCLDFEKMQQLQARSVTAWRHSGEPSGELPVYCW